MSFPHRNAFVAVAMCFGDVSIAEGETSQVRHVCRQIIGEPGGQDHVINYSQVSSANMAGV
jgi:hypothetical protein